MDDELHDQDLRAALQRRADALTGPIDTDVALWAVRDRSRRRARGRVLATTVGALAAAAVAVVVVGSVVRDERTTLRTPASPSDAPATAPPTASTIPAATTPAPTLAPSTTPRTQPAPPATTAVPATQAPATPAPTNSPTTSPPTAPPAATTTLPAPATRTFSSRGGSIVVRHEGGTITLDGDPSPSSGWSYRIDDDGPTRVRVRFESADARSEIRIDLEGDELVPTIVEE